MSQDTGDRDEFIHWDEDRTKMPNQSQLCQNQTNRLLSKYTRIEEEKVPAHLQSLGFVSGKKRFHGSHTHTAQFLAEEFIRANLFLQQGASRSNYIIFRCNNRAKRCNIDVKMFNYDDGTCILKISEGPLWHSSTCQRVLQGPRGVSKSLDANEAPAKSLVARVAQEAIETSQEVIALTQRQVYIQVSYKRRKEKASFEMNPTALLDENFPGTIGYFQKLNEDFDIVCVTRPRLLELITAQHHMHVDATYFFAPRKGNVVTLGYSQWDSFIPVFVCTSFPTSHNVEKKSPEDTAYFTAIFAAFVEALKIYAPSVSTTWVPKALIRDHASAIKHGCNAAFALEVEDFVCFFHFTQREKMFFESVKMPDDLKDQMMTFSRALHMAQSEEDYIAGLMLLTAHRHPMWMLYADWLRSGHHLPGSVNARWAVSQAKQQRMLEVSTGKHIERTQNGLERYHRELNAAAKRLCFSGHLNIMRGSFIIAKCLQDTQHLLSVSVPGYNLPSYFEEREKRAKEDYKLAESLSAEYLSALQHLDFITKEVTWTRDSSGKVLILDDVQIMEIKVNSPSCIAAWLAWQKITRTTIDSCDCVCFRKNPFAFCRHVLALRHYTEQVNSLQEVVLSPITPSPHKMAPCITPTISLPRRKPLGTLNHNSDEVVLGAPSIPAPKKPKRPRSGARSNSPQIEVTPPRHNSWHHPSPRKTRNSSRRSDSNMTQT